jgi:hypothetical protein
MKDSEKVSCVIKPEYLLNRDPQYISDFGIDTEKLLYLDLHMKELVRVDDLFKDGTTFYKTLKKGEGSASPYIDSFVHRKFKVKVCN